MLTQSDWTLAALEGSGCAEQKLKTGFYQSQIAQTLPVVTDGEREDSECLS